MARPLRIEIQGGWFHVTSRGQNRDRIFKDLADAVNFADRLAQLPERFGVEVHAYVMMPNHYHLLLRTPRGGLSRAVQWLNTGYSIWWNNRHGRVGHVFQGRFKSILVEEGQRLLELSLYLHFNPVAVEALGLSKGKRAAAARGLDDANAEMLEKRLQTLRVWRWSSYRALAGYEPAPNWLNTNEILPRAGGSTLDYRALAESRLAALGGAVWSDLHKGIILGTPVFAEQTSADIKLHREHKRPADWSGHVQWSELVSWIEHRRSLPWTELSRKKHDWGRNLAWWAGHRWAGITLRELGEASGGIDYATVAKAIERLPASASKNPELQQALSDITNFVQERLSQ